MTETVIATAVALTVGIVWTIRQTGFVPDRLTPILSLFIGAGWAFLLGAQGYEVATFGVMIGLMASGAWSGTKNLVSGGKPDILGD